MSEPQAGVREICWRSLCPWLLLFRTFAIATSLPVLLLATSGALLTPVGWRVGESLFLDEQSLQDQPGFRQVVELNRRWPGDPAALPVPNAGRIPESVGEILKTEPNPLETLFLRFVQPAGQVIWFGTRLPVTRVAYYLFGLLWTLVVWAFFGGAITRMAAMTLGREERIGLRSALRHASHRLGAYVASPLFPLFGVLLAGLPVLALGTLLRPDWAVPLVGLLWIVALLCGVVSTVLLLGLLFGWPLMWGTIACEPNGDAFEAFSRSYSYTFQRPLHYLFYALLATLFGGLGWLLVYHFSEAVIRFADMAAAIGAGGERWEEMERLRQGAATGQGGLLFGSCCISLYAGLVRSIATGFGYSLFWCLAAAIYLLLRRDVDQTEFDEVFADQEDLAYALPPLPTDPAGVPGVPAEKPASQTGPAGEHDVPPPASAAGADSAS